MVNSGCCAQLVSIKSVGCRTNQEEMVTLRFQLENEGYAVTDTLENADIIIVNTCAVTSGTESKTRRLVSSLASDYPNARILITGCLAQQNPDELKKMRNVNWVVGNTCKHEIPKLLKQDSGIFHSNFIDAEPNDLHLDASTIISPHENGTFVKTRYPIKIQEGCDFRCSYCIVPSLRGPSRSASENAIVKLCHKVIDAGYKEIVLTGTHIGQYGKEYGSSLIKILHSLLAIKGDFRIRLSSLDPRDLGDELFNMVETEDRICNHLHVSLQSLSDEVLKRMNRPYDNIDAITEKLIAFRDRVPYAGLGADFIVGFPGETDENFNETVEKVKKINFSYAHVFRYSIRPATAAAAMSDQIAESVKTGRSNLLRSTVDESRRAFIKKSNGITEKIIVESEHPVRGLTSNYLHVEIPDLKAKHNTWIEVSITGEIQGRFCLAEPVICEVV